MPIGIIAGTAIGGMLAGAGVCVWAAVHPLAQLFGPTIRFTGDPASVALTFDDGPNPAATPRLLQLLDDHHAKATFFLIGSHVRECPALAAEIAARGHILGNHTHTHPNLIWQTPAQIVEELARCREAIEQAAGVTPHWMRPPYGFRGPHLDGVVRRSGYRGVVMWSVIARDWKPQPLPTLVGRLRPVGGGDIVVLHDGSPRGLGADRSQTLRALDFWLPRWIDAGFRFVTLEEVVQPAARRVVSHGAAA